jgi:hypothetical protein
MRVAYDFPPPRQAKDTLHPANNTRSAERALEIDSRR